MHATSKTVHPAFPKTLAAPARVDSEAGKPPLVRKLTMIWLVGMLVLLPLDTTKLPLNLSFVDCWILVALPVFWLSFI